MISWEQNIINAQVSVNRSVWALNERMPVLQSGTITKDYIISESKEAIKHLQDALTELEGTIDFNNIID